MQTSPLRFHQAGEQAGRVHHKVDHRDAEKAPRPLVIAAEFALFALVSFCHAEFRFAHHFIDPDLPGKEYGQTSRVDIDRDGDLDFITGGKDLQKHVFWFEYQSPDKWVRPTS